jgi:Arc/MetJ-type ribon-helix-helix transcriptional regulator
MTTQIAVRLPDPVVEFLDREVSAGRASSRAAVVASALEREMRRLLAERDVEILQREGAADDLDGLVDWTAGRMEPDD